MSIRNTEERGYNEIRPMSVVSDYLDYPMGSVLIEMGRTRVLCTASMEEKVPKFLLGTGKGWITAEYAMLPASTHTRKERDIKRLKADGRSTEIQRLIGRSIRSVVDLSKMPDISIVLDCDVIQADGGTRCASINGAYLALKIAVEKLLAQGLISDNPIMDSVGAVSAGIVEDKAMVDLDYREDSNAQVDMNVVMTGSGSIIEIQGTGEERPFTREELDSLLEVAEKGIRKIFEITGV